MNSHSVPTDDYLRLCINCKHSRVYNSTNKRNVWYYCVLHGVSVHFNETCESYYYEVEEKTISSLKDIEKIKL